ncbi:HalOD1 output domain-containing protein, partial [Natrialbaceae archaeon A-arb3/5]
AGLRLCWTHFPHPAASYVTLSMTRSYYSTCSERNTHLFWDCPFRDTVTDFDMVDTDHSRPSEDAPIVVRTDRHESESVLQSVVRAVAARKNVPVEELPPLYEQVDSDALTALFDHAERRRSTITFEFVFAGETVVVSHGRETGVRDGGSL